MKHSWTFEDQILSVFFHLSLKILRINLIFFLKRVALLPKKQQQQKMKQGMTAVGKKGKFLERKK